MNPEPDRGVVTLPRYNKVNGFVLEPRPHQENLGMGIKFFDGNPIPSTRAFSEVGITPEQLRDQTHVWRPEETLEAAAILGENGRVLIRGAPQSGKGSILFGISSICDLKGWGYAFVDGHHQEAPSDFVARSIRRASTERKAIFFDSFDYLFGGPKLRRLPVSDQEIRTARILEAISDASVPVALTMHDEFWAKRFLDAELLAAHIDFLNRLPRYNLPMELASLKSAMQFLVDHGFRENEAITLLGLPENGMVLDFIINNHPDGKALITQVEKTVRNYTVLKAVARTIDCEVKTLIGKINAGEKEAIEILISLLRTVEEESVFLPYLRKPH